ncbi:GAF domain-containing protein [Paraburkholderia heleia]|uniref:GAF domain-containing protein n=1 Tax=Paraburkholderia heleia TaxID=634127 RepID=UPI002AB667F3|nr:GAF domain-containing protein [Paraburkholderia heleia]
MAPKSRSPAVADIDARPSRAPDHARENQALLALVTAQLDSREVLLQRIADFAMRLCRAQSAGISLLEHEGEERYFRWHSVAGRFANLCGTRTHWSDCPCAVVLEAGKPLLFTALSDDFPVLAPACAVVQEALIVPIVSKGRQLGCDLGRLARTPIALLPRRPAGAQRIRRRGRLGARSGRGARP